MMFRNNQASIAIFGYRDAPAADFAAIVASVDALLQNTDAEPRTITWIGQQIALIDRVGVRIGLGVLPPSGSDTYHHLILVVGEPTDPSHDSLLAMSPLHLADKLVQRMREDMPYDTVLRAETPEPVDEDLFGALFDLVSRTSTPVATPETIANVDTPPGEMLPSLADRDTTFDVLLPEEVAPDRTAVDEWLDRRAHTSAPLRLTVHTVALSVMLYTPPLGAFFFTYSMLRDMAGKA